MLTPHFQMNIFLIILSQLFYLIICIHYNRDVSHQHQGKYVLLSIKTVKSNVKTTLVTPSMSIKTQDIQVLSPDIDFCEKLDVTLFSHFTRSVQIQIRVHILLQQIFF